MNKKYFILVWVIGIFLIILQLSAVSFSQTSNVYHNAMGHFSFVLPDGWVQVSNDVLNETSQTMSKLSGRKLELAVAFSDKNNSDIYAIIQIKANGRHSESNFEKLISNGQLKSILQGEVLKFPTGIKFTQPSYDKKRHVLYTPIKFTNKFGISTMFLSNYGMVTMVFYAPDKDFDKASDYFKKIINSFNFDEGYRYLDGQKERESTFSILPKSVAACVLLFMAIYLSGYWWKSRWMQIIFIIFIAFICAIMGQIIPYLHDLSPDLGDGLDLGLAILIGVFWFWQYRKFKKIAVGKSMELK